MFNLYIEESRLQNLQSAQVTSPDTVSVEEVFLHLCGVIFEADILTEIVMLQLVFYLRFSFFPCFSAHVRHCFFLKVSLLTKTQKKSFRLLHRERKSGRVPRKVLVQQRRLPEKNSQRKLHYDIFQTPDRLVRRRRKFQRKRAKKRRKQEP